MIRYKTREEVEIIKESADILARAHGEVARHVKAGISTKELDKVADEYIGDHKARPSFKGYNGFPAALCISVNEQVVHGIPGNYELKPGDVVSVDCGVYYKGFHSDSAYSYPVEVEDEEVLELLRHTRESLYLGIENALYGNRVGDISHAIQKHTEGFGYGVVRELVGHGVGKDLHEGPEIPNYGKRGKGTKLMEGMVIAIEPMINLGTRKIIQEADGWTIRTSDRKPSAHYEHTVAIWKDQTEILTSFKYIEENYKW